MERQFLARYNKTWQNIKTGQIVGEKLTLKGKEKLTDYRQVSKKIDSPKETAEPQTKSKTKQPEDKPAFSFAENKDEKGVF